jgi:hypothetical protein
MVAELTYAHDDHVMDDVFDTGDPRSFVDDLVLAERFHTAAFEELVSPAHAMRRIGAALFGMARRACLAHREARRAMPGSRASMAAPHARGR